MLWTLDSGVGNNSRKALLTAPDTLFTAINISCGDDEDKGDDDDYAGPGTHVGGAERNKTDMVLGPVDLTAWWKRHVMNT